MPAARAATRNARTHRRTGEVEEAQCGHWREVTQRVVGQLPEQRNRQRVAVAHQQQGVAIGTGLRHPLRGDDAAGAGPVVDHHRLAQRARHGLAHGARREVGDAAGAERHDQRDRSLGKTGLGTHAERRGGGGHGGAGGSGGEPSAAGGVGGHGSGPRAHETGYRISTRGARRSVGRYRMSSSGYLRKMPCSLNAMRRSLFR